MIDRRTLIAGSLAIVPQAGISVRGLAGEPPGPAFPPRPPHPARPASQLDRMMNSIPARLNMECPQTGESWQGRFYDRRAGRYDSGALESLEHFLRDWREGIRVEMCVRLHWALAAATHRSLLDGGSGVVEILSGYRTPRTNSGLPGAAADSMHMYGRAVDFRVGGMSLPALSGMMRRLGVGGVGHYRSGGFVHIDSGRPRSWSDGT